MIKRIKRRLSQSFSKDQNVEDTFSEMTIEDRGAKENGSSKNFLKTFTENKFQLSLMRIVNVHGVLVQQTDILAL